MRILDYFRRPKAEPPVEEQVVEQFDGLPTLAEVFREKESMTDYQKANTPPARCIVSAGVENLRETPSSKMDLVLWYRPLMEIVHCHFNSFEESFLSIKKGTTVLLAGNFHYDGLYAIILSDCSLLDVLTVDGKSIANDASGLYNKIIKKD